MLGYKVKGQEYGGKNNYDDQKNVDDTDGEVTKLISYLKSWQAKSKDVISDYLHENKNNAYLKQNYDGKSQWIWIYTDFEYYNMEQYIIIS